MRKWKRRTEPPLYKKGDKVRSRLDAPTYHREGTVMGVRVTSENTGNLRYSVMWRNAKCRITGNPEKNYTGSASEVTLTTDEQLVKEGLCK
jgi:hypothetical protein